MEKTKWKKQNGTNKIEQCFLKVQEVFHFSSATLAWTAGAGLRAYR